MIESCLIQFDELKIFIVEKNCSLKVLRITTESEDRNYIDDEQWEKFILNNLPRLKTFHLQYYQQIDPQAEPLVDLQPPNSFTSLFWNERKWVLETEMNYSVIQYTVCPYR